MIVANLLIVDKSSVSSCVSVFVLTLIDFTGLVPSLDQLVDESAGNQIDWTGFWGEVYAGGGTCTCSMYMQEKD